MYKKKIEEKMRRQQEIVNAAKKENSRSLTSEEQHEFDSLQRDIELLKELEEENANGTPSTGDGNIPTNQNGRDLTQEEEKQRCLDITTLCRSFNVEPDEYIRDGKTLDFVRTLILENLMNSNTPIGTRGSGEANVTKAEEDKYRTAAADAILMRGGVNIPTPADGANELRAMSMRDLAIESLAKEGETNLHRRSSDELFSMLQRQYFNPSAAFPAIMDQAINKAYVEGHKTVPVTFDKWVKKGSLSDFKIHDNYYLSGPAGEFLRVPEGGELKHDIFSDAKKPQRKLETYGRQFTMTRQAFINDDIGVLSSIPAKYAASARKTQNTQVYEVLVNNPAIYDGIRLFDAQHRNVLTSGSGINQQTVQKMLLILQTQKNEFNQPIIIRPKTIIVPIGYAFDMYTLFNSPTINTSSNTQATNPLYRYKSMIEVVEDPTINALCGGFGNQMPWWMVGDPSDTDFMEIDYLNGQEIPTIRRAEVPGTLGLVWDVYLDWGISVMDYRGVVKNPGMVIADPLM